MKRAWNVRACGAERGQALPLSLACLVGACLLLGFCLRSGERLVQRERVRMLTDVTAFSGGISYARGLNVLALSDKAVLGGWLATLLSGGSAYGTVQKLQQAQAVMLKAGPWLAELSLLQVGADNGLLVLPVWNKPVLFQDLGESGGRFSGFALKDLKPAFNVGAYTLLQGAGDALQGAVHALGPGPGAELPSAQAQALAHSGLTKAQEGLNGDAGSAVGALLQRFTPGLDLDWLFKTDHYEYRRRSDGSVVTVGTEHAGVVYEDDGHGGLRKKYKADADFKHKYVMAVEMLDEKLQLKLTETGPHALTLLSLQAPSRDPRQGRPGWVCALSQVQVAGGDFDITDPEAAGFGPFFMPVRLFDKLRLDRPGLGLHGIRADLPLPGEPSAAEGRMEAAGLAALLAHLAPGAPAPLRSALQTADDLLAVQH